MRIPKRYGESRIDKCPFCGTAATTNNPEGVPVCSKHKDSKLPPMRCICGECLDLKKGKWGPYFSCIRCGNIAFRKALEANPDLSKEDSKETSQKKAGPAYKVIHKSEKETTITSDELDFY